MPAKLLWISLMCILLVVASLAPNVPSRTSDGLRFLQSQVVSTYLNLSFPSMVNMNDSRQLASALAASLQLGAISLDQAAATSQSNSVIDGLNDTLWNLPESQVFGQDLFSVPASGGATVGLYYSESANGDGVFAFGEISNFSASAFSPEGLTSSNVGTALSKIATALRIPLNGTEQVRTYMNGTWIDATLYSSFEGRVVEFANQLQLISPPSGVGASLRLFPWIARVPTPSVSEDIALVWALQSINTTFKPTNGTFGNPVANWFLDTAHVSFGYSFRLSYNESDFSRNGVYVFVAWIDWLSGQTVRLQAVHLVPGGAGIPAPPWIPFLRWPGVLIPVGGSVGAVLGLLLVFEASRMSLLYFLAFLFFRLRREHALEHFTRGRIFETVRSIPGVTFSDVRDRLSLGNGVAAYHLMVLEKMGLVVSRKDGRLRHYFSHDTPEKVVKQRLSPLQYAILDSLASSFKRPAELARELKTSRQRVAYNLKRLQKAGFISAVPGQRELGLTPGGVEARRERIAAEEVSPDGIH